MKHLALRPATADDAAFIARGIYTAFLIDMDALPESEQRLRMDAMTTLCGENDMLYSYHNTTIATVDGEPAGMLIAYDGQYWTDHSAQTFARLNELFSHVFGDDFDKMDDEATAGEYYLDSIAVRSEFRGMGIGTMLLKHGIQQAQALGLGSVTLAVDKVNPRAKALYQSLGFKDDKEIFIFNEDFMRMRLTF